jgi:hypothetical protein
MTLRTLGDSLSVSHPIRMEVLIMYDFRRDLTFARFCPVFDPHPANIYSRDGKRDATWDGMMPYFFNTV